MTAAADGTIRIWDAASDQQLAEFHASGVGLTSAAMNNSGTQLVTTSDDGIARIVNLQTGNVTAQLQQSGHALSSAAFAPTGGSL